MEWYVRKAIRSHNYWNPLDYRRTVSDFRWDHKRGNPELRRPRRPWCRHWNRCFHHWYRLPYPWGRMFHGMALGLDGRGYFLRHQHPHRHYEPVLTRGRCTAWDYHSSDHSLLPFPATSQGIFWKILKFTLFLARPLQDFIRPCKNLPGFFHCRGDMGKVNGNTIR